MFVLLPSPQPRCLAASTASAGHVRPFDRQLQLGDHGQRRPSPRLVDRRALQPFGHQAGAGNRRAAAKHLEHRLGDPRAVPSTRTWIRVIVPRSRRSRLARADVRRVTRQPPDVLAGRARAREPPVSSLPSAYTLAQPRPTLAPLASIARRRATTSRHARHRVGRSLRLRRPPAEAKPQRRQRQLGRRSERLQHVRRLGRRARGARRHRHVLAQARPAAPRRPPLES